MLLRWPGFPPYEIAHTKPGVPTLLWPTRSSAAPEQFGAAGNSARPICRFDTGRSESLAIDFAGVGLRPLPSLPDGSGSPNKCLVGWSLRYGESVMKRLIRVAVSVGAILAAVGGCGDEQQPPPVFTGGGLASTTTAGSEGVTTAGSQGCAAGLMACGLTCVNPLADVGNCGGCGVLCSSGQQCLSGSCQCVPGLTACDSCVDLASDAANCGGCGVVCGAGQVCSLSACSTTCAAGLAQCGQSCTDTSTDLANCGVCGNICPAGRSCVAGACTCSAGADCSGACVDTQIDLANCGSCGLQCSAGQICQAGLCMGGVTATSGGVSVGGTVDGTTGTTQTTGATVTTSGGGATSTSGSETTAGTTTTGAGGATSTGGAQTTGGATTSGGGTTSTGGSQTTASVTTSGGNTTSTTGSSTGDGEPLSQTYQSLATFYFEANGGGACLFDPTSDVHVAALSYTLYGIATWCGACAHVEGPNGSTTVRIVDLCPPTCGTNNLDLHPEAWDEIASPRSLGQVDIDWYFVPCDVSGNVAYRFKAGTTQWWTAIQVLNHRLPLKSLEWSANGGSSWSTAERMDYNYFVIGSGVGPNPFQVRITAIDGQVLVDQLPAPSNPEPATAGPAIPGAGQFK